MTGYFPFQGMSTETDKLNRIINERQTPRQEMRALEKEVLKFLQSPKRQAMLDGERYYIGEHDILKRKRTVIGPDGEKVEAQHLPNNRRIDNQYAILVDQKINYLLAKPLTIETENEAYETALKAVFNKSFHRLLRNVGEASLNQGIAWLHPYYDEEGLLKFKRFPAHEILPFWQDADHSKLSSALRIYTMVDYEGSQERSQTKVEYYTLEGVEHYYWRNNSLVSADDMTSYIAVETVDEEQELKINYFNWERLPLVPFKTNHKELPLINRVKSLQDAYNKILSNFDNAMDQDTHNTIIVLENYDGQNLGEFRYNLAKFGAVKVRSDGSGSRGDVRTLEVSVNKDNFESILKLFKKAIVENGKGYDAKDDRMGNAPNQMNIQSMYMDIDLDANMIETEYQAAFEDLIWFVDQDLANRGIGDFSNEEVNIIFNRDILINEKEAIEGLEKSAYLSLETRIAQHPLVKDVRQELERIKKEQAEIANMYDGYDQSFGGGVDGEET